MTDLAAIKGVGIVGGLLGTAAYGGHVMAEAITKDSNVSLEAACIVGCAALVIAGMFINLKRDVREVKKGLRQVKKHIGHCAKASGQPVPLELEDGEEEDDK